MKRLFRLSLFAVLSCSNMHVNAQTISWINQTGLEFFQYGDKVSSKNGSSVVTYRKMLPFLESGVLYKDRFFISELKFGLFEFGGFLFSAKAKIGFNSLFWLKKGINLGPFIEISRIRPTSIQSLSVISNLSTPWEVKYIGNLGLQCIIKKYKVGLTVGQFYSYDSGKLTPNVHEDRFERSVKGLNMYARLSVSYLIPVWERESKRE